MGLAVAVADLCIMLMMVYAVHANRDRIEGVWLRSGVAARCGLVAAGSVAFLAAMLYLGWLIYLWWVYFGS